MATQFKTIQAARAFAANAVLMSHLVIVENKYAHGFGVLPTAVAWGAGGVDLFFVVSGFIMATVAAREDVRTFVVSRLTRIYPPYWFYSLLVLCLSLVAPNLVNNSVEQAPVLWRSFLLFPDSTLPLLAVGWTLVHEMYFYVVFALLLKFGKVRPIFLLLWALCCVCVRNLADPMSPLLAVMAHPLTLEFIAGVYVGLVVRAGITRGSQYAVLVGGCLLIALVMFLNPSSVLNDTGGWLRVLVLGFPFTLIVYGITAKRSTDAQEGKSILEMIGDASYSIYLSHVLVLSALGRIFAALPIHSKFAEYGFLLLCISAANIWGIVSFRMIERPSLRFLRNRVPILQPKR